MYISLLDKFLGGIEGLQSCYGTIFEGVGVFRFGKIKNAQTRHNIDTTISLLLFARIVRNLPNLGLFTT